MGSRVSVASKWRVRVDTVKRGEPLVAVLERAGVPRDEAARVLRESQAIDARKIRAGTTITSTVSADSGASEVVLQLAIDRLVRFTRSATGGSRSGWLEKEETLPWTTDTVVVGGVVSSTLTGAIAQGADAFPANVRNEVAYALADILEYRVDLSRDLREGDTIKVLMERQRAPNGAVRPGDVIAARLTVDGRRVETMRFAQGSKSAYFDGEGKSMRAAFLRAPLAFRRISSVFGLRRHPILGTVRAHQGMDYAAARGTPVRALGDGVVIFAGWKGGYGRVLEIRHRNGFVTRYGHLNAFAPGIRRGTTVSISRTVAFVGTTGLSTAPHLHFEVLVNGKHRDPRVALRNVTGEPLASGQRASFDDLRARLFARLDGPRAASTAAAPVITRVAGD
ncbi:M23 family metallopeptidase [Gemmatimonas sp.]|uniref:M23 family metallopeptidase n=1 Tax=Gemmatimonas sp. TaxID=1962908 RepID=UPI00286C647A|nr:M23 family metallopeptidase [Gemmatimonas sp.]